MKEKNPSKPSQPPYLVPGPHLVSPAPNCCHISDFSDLAQLLHLVPQTSLINHGHSVPKLQAWAKTHILHTSPAP